ncbi:MAG: hypothetical protein V2J10_13285, partial [Wenzhouxiangella sp.]|nr:hypothetical protein [Wenzhouxiangella sp.]
MENETETQMELFDEFDTPETDSVSALEDISSDDAEESDLETVSELSNFVNEKFRKAEDKRQQDEYRWLMAYRNYRGIYGPDVQFREDEKSKAFVKVTKTKVLAAYGQICDVLFGSHKFPLTVEPTVLPDGIQETAHVNLDPNVSQVPEAKEALRQNTQSKAYRWKNNGERVPVEMISQPWLKDFIEEIGEENVIEGPGTTDKQITFHPAMKAAKKMEKKIHDQLDESNGNKHLRSAAFEGALYG